MWLKSIQIENFRGLQDISFELPSTVTVIVGPNAVGKSSVLEAIRLTKSILAPRYVGEDQQVLDSLGARIPSLNAFKLDSLFGDVSSPLRIALDMVLTTEELQLVKDHLPQLARRRVSNLLGNAGADELALVQYLSSPQGEEQYNNALDEAEEGLGEVEASRTISLSLEIEPTNLGVRGTSLFHQEVAQTLIGLYPPALGEFTYFPADRAMPSGEVNIQIGSSDAAAQMYSHLGQPATKYQRLKQHMVNQSLTQAAEAMRNDFATVFDKLLSGKELANFGLTQEGMLTVRIREPETDAVYDIDGMSSGEKGLLLTFFLMRRSTAPGGIILLDEPELHLNPAVTRKLMPFLLDEVLKPLEAQAIICTHSPEITAHAYDEADCTLLHLRPGCVISPVYPMDRGEVFEALRRLGTQTSDVLFSRGSLYVEGDDDADLLATGWPDRVAGYKINKLGGRDQVEKEIKNLQAAEREEKLDTSQYFVFDRDNKPTGLADTSFVRVRQWGRYCLENYLLDADAVYDVSKGNNFDNSLSRGELAPKLKDAALAQLRGRIAREIYEEFEPENPGLRRSDISSTNDFKELADKLSARVVSIKDQLAGVDASRWAHEFTVRCEVKGKELLPKWRKEWESLANGKLVLKDVYMELGANLSFADFKRRLVSEMSSKETRGWKEVDDILGALIPK